MITKRFPQWICWERWWFIEPTLWKEVIMSFLNDRSKDGNPSAPIPQDQAIEAPSILDDLHTDPQAGDEFILADAAPQGLEGAVQWRVAQSLSALKRQIDAAYPGRSKLSDGTIGDDRHRTRASDHNAHISDGGMGIVTAFDITHDPAHGCDAGTIAALLHASRDPRIKYIIWNHRIANSSPIGAAPAWAWRAYTGTNPHDKHCHLSVKASKPLYDDVSAWPLALARKGGTESMLVISKAEHDEGALADIEMALAALGGTNGKPLLQALVDASDAIGVLLSRYAQASNPGKASNGALEGPRPSFEMLRAEYEALFDACRINPSRASEVAWHRNRLLKYRPHYDEVAARTGAPWWFVGIVHALEASFNFAGHLHNGDSLTARTVQVPAGRPLQWNPPGDWVSSAVDAIQYEGHAGKQDWSPAIALYRFESYNGFGYRNRGLNTPYLWSFSNHYTAGKFVHDGKYDPAAVSKQCGAAVMLKALIAAGDVVLAG
ncbi:MAG TPA: hypothetical protein VGD30_07445 [Telluria sp.]